jgi:hypothetical protein
MDWGDPFAEIGRPIINPIGAFYKDFSKIA